MHLAFIHAKIPSSVDTTLANVVAILLHHGHRLAGVVQEPMGDADRHRCDMDLIEIASGQRIAISQTLGGGSTGCRLDPNAIETAAARVEAELEASPVNLLIINRFGKLESIGRGFCPVIAKALQRGIPVLVGVNDLNRPAFDSFAVELAKELPDLPSAVLAWSLPLLRKAAA
ncbi:DUF2478 domain-containing protein [Aestuariivirga sp.]|uniref:DUF2478 domain-containing protein n=1 Tax=Aestuariivirga sp. TaxID=2650926 RepID=UPI0035939FCE